jgi:diaminopimelate epimerase
LEINTLGGLLKVEFKKNPNNEFNNIWLSGEAKFVFKGNIRV